MAQYASEEFLVDGGDIELMPGQVFTSKSKLSKRAGISETTVERILTYFEDPKRSIITQKKTTNWRIITILNWHKYQARDPEKKEDCEKSSQDRRKIVEGKNGPPSGPVEGLDNKSTEGLSDTFEKSGPLTGPRMDHGWTTDGHIQEGKKVEKKTFLSDSIEIGLSVHLLDLIREHNPEFKTPSLQSWAREIDLMIRMDNRAPEKIRTVMEWAQADPFWHINVLSTSKLRQQYDMLVARMTKDPPRTAASNPIMPAGVVDGIVECYHKRLPGHPRYEKITDSMIRNLERLWADNPDHQTIEFWDGLFEYIAGLRTLTGRDYKHFVAPLVWILREDSFYGIKNGTYDNVKIEER
jgi:hypothetical protein